MKISEGEDNLIKSNRIPSWSAKGGSLGCLTHRISAIEDKQNLWFLYHRNGKGQKEVGLTYNKRDAPCFCEYHTKLQKCPRLLQPYFCTHLHWQEVNRTVSLCATFCKNNNYLGLKSINSKMLKMHPSSTDIRKNTRSASKMFHTENLQSLHIFSELTFDENILIVQVCGVQWWTYEEACSGQGQLIFIHPPPTSNLCSY